MGAGAPAPDVCMPQQCLTPQGPVLKEGVWCTEQDSLPGGVSREGSTTERCNGGSGPLAAAVLENWAGPVSFPLHDAVAEDDVEELPADIEDEFEGVLSCVGMCWRMLAPIAAEPVCTPSYRPGRAQHMQPPAPIQPHHRASTSHGNICAGVCAAGASSDEYSDVEDASGTTEVVFVKVRIAVAGLASGVWAVGSSRAVQLN